MADPTTKTAGEYKQEAIAATTAGIETEVAILLKKNSNAINLIVPGIGGKTDPEYQQLAKDLIDRKEVTIGGKKYTIDTLNGLVQDNPPVRKAMNEMGIETLHNAIPRRDQVNKIAGAVGDAVYENMGRGAGGASVGNTISAGWAYVLSFGTADTTATVAENFRSSAVNKLSTLRNTDPSLHVFLTEGADGTINKMGQAVYDKVTNPNTPAEDKLRKIKPDEPNAAIRNTVGKGIYEATYDATKKGIDTEVEKGYEAAGFMGSIAKMLGPDIANMLLSFLNFFIQMFGGESYALIPSENETNKVAGVVADSVRSVFTGKDAPQTAADANKAVQQSVRANLDKNAENFPSFTPAQIDKIVKEAGEGAQKNFDAIPKFGGVKTVQTSSQTPVFDGKFQAVEVSPEMLTTNFPSPSSPRKAVEPGTKLNQPAIS